MLDLNVSLPGGLKWIFSTLIKILFPSLLVDSSSSSFSFLLSSFHFLLLIFNLLFLITSLSDVQFLIRLILWCTHSIDFMETVPNNQILLLLLHIFNRTMLGSIKDSLYFLWLDYTFTGVLKLVMRLVFWFICFYSTNFHYCLGLIYLHVIKSK